MNGPLLSTGALIGLAIAAAGIVGFAIGRLTSEAIIEVPDRLKTLPH